MKTIITLLCLLSIPAQARTVRATEWDSSKQAPFGGEPLVVEFRQGDELPVAVNASGDLLETTRSGLSYVGVKKNFWIKFENNEVKMSIDGSTYKKIEDTIRGTLTAGAKTDERGGPASLIQFALDAKLK